MKFKISLVSCLFFASSLFANDVLLKKAENAGLKAIPSDKAKLLTLINDSKNPITEKRVELGKKLYFDPRISKSGLISCNTCHNLGLGGADGVEAAIGHKWTKNPHHLNSPTVYNSVFFDAQFWDGRSPHLNDQAKGPIEAEPEMATPAKIVVERINSIPGYVKEFKEAYSDRKFDKIDFTTIADTISVFERTLVTPSRFDEYLEGNTNALSKAEKEGLEVFIDKGCTSCHTGIAIGGSMQAFEVAGKYKFSKVGDFKGNKDGLVKTPTLRNIVETAPYFHNGQIWSLTDAIKEMGSIQLGIEISDNDAKKIETFLKSLTGKKPTISYPILPKSDENTPKPQYN